MPDSVLGTGGDVPVGTQPEQSAAEAEKDVVPVLLDRTGEAAEAKLTPAEQQRHHRVREHMQVRRERKATVKALLDASQPCSVPLAGVNLRDVGAVTRGPMRTGRVFRSSELLSKEEMKRHAIKTILDLRRMDRPCKKDPNASKVAESTETILKYLLWGPAKLVPEKRRLYAHRAQPHFCNLCQTRAGIRFQQEIHVVHADLIPSTVGLRIFQAMPKKVQAKALFMACTGKGAASVMAPAVANPLLLGYKALYRTLLEDSKRGMALALRPFVDEGNYPVLVHCIHGKDRTGLIIMLLLLLCDVEPEAIVDDYVLSETVLKESRLHDELNLDVYLTSDDVIAATRDTMEETIAYITEKYESAAGYMREIGLEDWEIERIRANLVQLDSTAAQPLPPRQRFSFHTLLPFARRSSAPLGQASSAQRQLRRTSSPLPSKLSTKHEQSALEGQKSAEREQTPADEGNPILRRASLANSGPAEIRSILRQLREQHPELGSISEAEPVDFLRNSPVRVPSSEPAASSSSSGAPQAGGRSDSREQSHQTNGGTRGQAGSEIAAVRAAGKAGAFPEGPAKYAGATAELEYTSNHTERAPTSPFEGLA